jgi:phosphoglycolate phosphatase-like HAD superfamily hydrolase
MKKKAVVFDWDGTLFASMDVKRGNFIKIFCELGGAKEELEVLHRKYSGIPRKELFSSIYAECFGRALPNEEYVSLSDLYTSLNLNGTKDKGLYSDAIEFLNSHSDLKFFVSTSAVEEEFRYNYERLNLETFILSGVASRPGFSKGTEHVEWILSKFNLKKPDLLFVGDELQDIKLAKMAGIDGVLIDRTKRFPELPNRIENMRDLQVFL